MGPSRLLEGQSQVFGVKFTPGGFRPFVDQPVSSLAGKTVPAHTIFGDDLRTLEAAALFSTEDEKVEAANHFFRARMPRPDSAVHMAAELVDRILQEREIQTVDGLVRRSGLGKLALQRIFNEYVGAAPNWVIRRYRLHEALETMQQGGQPDWPSLALQLGYFDQAHLIKDFRALIGVSPSQYIKQLTADG